MRRQLRERRREREARLLDLGALVYELHRQGKRAPELLQEKAAELALVDEQVRELEAALDGDDDGGGGGDQTYAGPTDGEADEAGPEGEADDEADELEPEPDEAATTDEPDDSAQTEEADALDPGPDGDEERPA